MGRKFVISLGALAFGAALFSGCRTVCENGDGPLRARVIELAPGVTRLERPLVLGPEDSGMVIRGAADGSSVLSGAVELKGLAFERAEDGVWSAPCDAKDIDQLFVNGVRYAMARFPNRREGCDVYDAWTLDDGAGYGVGNRYDASMDALLPARIARWRHPETGYLHAMHDCLWGDMHWKILGVKPDGTLKLEGGWQNNRSSPMHPVFRFVENIREELDAPGEWFLDREAGRLLVVPLAGVELATAKIESVRLESLVEIRGDAHHPVRCVKIENVTFTGASRTFMENREPLLRSDWTLCRGAAVAFTGAECCTLTDCRFRDLGGNAVIFDGWNRSNAVERCDFREIGASGVVFAGRPSAVRNPLFAYADVPDYAALDRTPGPKTDDYPRDSRVTACRFERTGRDEKQTAAVEITIAARIAVTDTFIRKTPRAAINIGDGCFGGHLIEGCDVAETVLETGDHGAFNSWGRDRYWQSDVAAFEREVAKDPGLPFLDAVEPTVIRGNRWRCDHGWDVDLDDGSSNYLIESNVFLKGGLKLREGYRRIVRGNRCETNTLHPHCWPEASGDVVVSNLWAGPFAAIGVKSFDGATVKDNVFLSAGGDKAGPATAAWGDGKVREFDGRAEFSAFGVKASTRGVVVIRAPSGTGLKAGDLVVDVTLDALPALPLAAPVGYYRNQSLRRTGGL